MRLWLDATFDPSYQWEFVHIITRPQVFASVQHRWRLADAWACRASCLTQCCSIYEDAKGVDAGSRCWDWHDSWNVNVFCLCNVLAEIWMHWLHTPVAIRKQHFIPPITPRFPRLGPSEKNPMINGLLAIGRYFLDNHNKGIKEWTSMANSCSDVNTKLAEFCPRPLSHFF